jgi:hypothetical protein
LSRHPVQAAADNELRELNFQASLPHEEQLKGFQGIGFPYGDLELNAEASWRIKPDTTFTMSDGSHPKYLSRIGDQPRAFFRRTTTLELPSDPKIHKLRPTLAHTPSHLFWGALRSVDIAPKLWFIRFT